MIDASTPDLVQAEVVARLPEAAGNITFTPQGRLVFSLHPFYEPTSRVVMLESDMSSTTSFPNEEWNTPREENDHFLDSVLGIRSDGRGVVWMLDMGTRTGITPKLVGWNTNTDSLERIYYIPAPATLPESQHNDFTIDEKRGLVIIADEGIARGGDGTPAALVTIDMKTGVTRRRLQGHVSALPEDVTLRSEGRDLLVDDGHGGQRPLQIGADGIVADLEFEFLYFGPLSGGSVYRVRLDDLANQTLDDEQLGERVERYCDKPNNGGMSIDRDSNLYLTAVETTTVGVVESETRQYRPYAGAENMIWPDGVSYSPDGYMYVSAAQVSRAAEFNNGQDLTSSPFLIYRFKPLAPGRPGY